MAIKKEKLEEIIKGSFPEAIINTVSYTHLRAHETR